MAYLESWAYGLAYDWMGQNIYYTDGKQIGVCPQNGKNCTVVIDDLEECTGIVVDPNHG